jgi:hypothetical protein
MPAVVGRLFAALPGLQLVDPDLERPERAAQAERRVELLRMRRELCVLCRERKMTASLVAGPSDLIGPRKWLDVCPPCYHDLQQFGVGMISGLFTDADIIRWYSAWDAAS